MTLALLTALPVNTQAATLTGKVTAQDTPVAGALVTLWNESHNRKETVYTNASGEYSLTTGFSGQLILRGRATNLKDVNLDIQISADTDQAIDLQLGQFVSPEEVSAALTASAHAATLPFPDQETKTTFISQCTYCHQQGNSLTRIPRKVEAWSKAIWRMEGYGAYVTYGEHKRIAETLHKGFDGQPVEALQTPLFTPDLSKAKVEEWHAGGPMSFLHDTIIGADGKLYGIDEGNDKLFVLDRETSKIEEYDMPVTDEVVGGNFRGMQLPIGIFTGKHGPHSGAQISDGRIYLTGALSSNLIMFNPQDKSWKLYPIPQGFLWRKGLYSHTIRRDREDNLWFTVLISNTVMRFNPHTETFTEIELPHNGALKWFTDTFIGLVLKVASFFPQQNTPLALSHHKWMNGGRDVFNWPYGIDVNPVNGDIWYGKLLADKIGRIDPETLEVTEYDVPHVGPRRLRFGPDGILWIPSFDEGKLMRFDPQSESFESIDLPLMGVNEYETPYALNVHHDTGDVWIAANNSDRLLRYIPGEKRFIAYPMPSQVVWFRDLEFTTEGEVCTSNSNLPAYAHEDGLPAFFCLDPDYL
ncbi:MAG: hypothetical protein HOC23_15210 [Halieaceae bacterium]|nr:hypothetical protein [Halieaceae bacterium]